jgi:outer membrane protein OmpA-like peptidoglycan-associated protein
MSIESAVLSVPYAETQMNALTTTESSLGDRLTVAVLQPNTFRTKLEQSVRRQGPAAAAALLLAIALAAAPVEAGERASKSESVGVATGFAIGAAAGGPVGAIVGAATGAWIGDRHHRQAAKIDDLSTTVALTQNEAERLAYEVRELNDSLVAQDSNASNVQGVVHFRTGETGVRAEDAPRVARLANWLSSYEHLQVRVMGYADPRGPQDLNASLALERAESVANLLRAAGVSDSRIVVVNAGVTASPDLEPTLDNYAFERRVEIVVEPAITAVAQRE